MEEAKREVVKQEILQRFFHFASNTAHLIF